VPIFYKTDRTDPTHYRPISLINFDAKLLSLVLTRRLRRVIGSLVSDDQTGFIPGRYILDNVALVQGLVRQSRNQDHNSALVFLDQEKAYDRMSWSFLRKALTKAGIGPKFSAMVDLLYAGATSSVLVNGWKSPAFALHRGVRQGDPLSPLLYDLVDEAFANYIRACPSLRGITLPGAHASLPPIKILSYADDKVIALSDPRELSVLQEAFTLYELATFSKINWRKTVGLLLGPEPDEIVGTPWHRISLGTHIRWWDGEEPLRYLGYSIAPIEVHDQVWERVVARMESTLARWSRRNLTLTGKVTVIRTLALSQLWYVASLTPLPRATERRIETSIWSFLWSDKSRGPVARDKCLAPVTIGGLGMMHVKSMVAALHLRWLQHLLDHTNGKWKFVATHELVSSPFSRQLSLGPATIISAISLPRRGDSVAPLFWREIIQAWQDLQGQQSEPTTWDEVLNERVFFNRLIVDPNTQRPFTPTTLKSLFRARLFALRQIWDASDHRWRSYQDLGISRASHDRLLAAINPAWIALANAPHDWRTDDWFAACDADVDVHQVRVVFKVCDQHQVERYVVHPAGVLALSEGEADVVPPVVPPPLAPRRRVIVVLDPLNGSRGRLVGFADTVSVDPNRLTILLKQGLQAPSRVPFLRQYSVKRGRHSLSALSWKEPLGVQDRWIQLHGGAVNWRRVWLFAHLKSRVRVESDLLWRLLHRSLPVGSYLRHWNADARLVCAHQGCGDTLETHEHLFLHCPVAQDVWEWVFTLFDRIFGIALTPSLGTMLLCDSVHRWPRARQQVFVLLHGSALYSIWLARNAALFEGGEFSAAVIRRLAIARINRHLSTLFYMQPRHEFITTWTGNAVLCSIADDDRLVLSL